MNVVTFPMSSIGYTWVGLFYVVILLIAVSQPGNLLTRVLRNRLLTGFGRISYGAYLFHIAFFGFCYAALRNHAPPAADLGDFAATALAFGLTIALACASWFFFEKPLLKIGHRYSYRFPKPEKSD
jgi:peptidoglycan/LPS O-acetylase OafA/YrhL